MPRGNSRLVAAIREPFNDFNSAGAAAMISPSASENRSGSDRRNFDRLAYVLTLKARASCKPAIFSPYDRSRTDCRTCRHWSSAAPVSPDHVWCLRNHIVMGMPQHGCCQYAREPGSDDELPRSTLNVR